MIIDCVSDLHGFFPELEGGDLLIIAGDMTTRDSESCWIKFFRWINTIIPIYKKIIIIGGNHDNRLQSGKTRVGNPLVSYLCDEWTELEGLKIWGSPWTNTFDGINPICCAFTLDTDEQLSMKWDKIPEDVDILVTHSPPLGILDSCINSEDNLFHNVGSSSLSDCVERLYNLKLHVFGHIHEHGGQIKEFTRNSIGLPPVQMINASHVDENYCPINEPVRIIL